MRSHRLLRAVPPALLLVGALLLAHCHGVGSPRVTAGARLWYEGPVRWLMLPAEEREFRRLRTNREVLEFIEAFWQRRDPTPGDPENPFRQRFARRVEAADRLYAEPGRRGGLTDRGRVLILFGPPPILRYEQKAVPVLEPARRQVRGQGKSRWMIQELWVYPRQELGSELQEMLAQEGAGGEISFVFMVEGRHTYLLEGEEYCELAARAALAR